MAWFLFRILICLGLSLKGGVSVESLESLENCLQSTRSEDFLHGIEGYDEQDTERISCMGFDWFLTTLRGFGIMSSIGVCVITPAKKNE